MFTIEFSAGAIFVFGIITGIVLAGVLTIVTAVAYSKKNDKEK